MHKRTDIPTLRFYELVQDVDREANDIFTELLSAKRNEKVSIELWEEVLLSNITGTNFN